MIKARPVFANVGGGHPPMSMFDLSYSKTMTCDMGQLIPVMCDEMVPGDRFIIGNQMILRMQPLVAPILHRIDVTVHYFFVPYRLLWTDWETFITRGIDGDQTPVLPRWEPTNTAEGSLWDYMGLPTGVDPDGAYPIDMIRRAYNYVYNEYYRDETLTTPVALTNEAILQRSWAKDYFTSALLNQQRGTAPALPISGTTSAEWAASITNGNAKWGTSTEAPTQNVQFLPAGNHPFGSNGSKTFLESNTVTIPKASLDANTVDLSSASTFDVADLRLAFQMQKFLERNSRAGYRYVEFLQSQYAVSPRDDRLQRPEYVGGTKSPVIISEVLQTSKTDGTPQGNMAGHGINVNNGFAGKYYAQEFGLMIGIMSIMPEAMYQQGIDRQWLRTTSWDFFNPLFSSLSEQAVIRAELYASGVSAENNTLFGYQGRYNEMRCKKNMVCGEMRTTYDYWHMSRQFAAAPELNATFVECNPRKDVFAAPAEPGLIVSFGNLIKAYRPLPVQAEPGLIDHY